MSILKSGMWCDLCGKPILEGEWWNIGIKRENGDTQNGHSCGACKLKHEREKTRPVSDNIPEGA